MQIGVNTWVWGAPLTNRKLDRLAETVADTGFDLVEVPLEARDDLDLERAAETIRSAGLSVSTAAVMTPERDLVHPEDADRETGEAYLQWAIDATATLGGTNLVGPMYSATGRTWRMSDDERDAVEADLIDALGSLAEYADGRDVQLCLEPLNRFETSLVNTTEQGRRIVDAVDHPSLRLLLDTFHMNIEDPDVPDAIRNAGDRVGHVHACANDRGAPGTGHVPWDRVGRALREIEYSGPVVIESFTPEVESIATAASVWRPLADSQDELARTGLETLRRIVE